MEASESFCHCTEDDRQEIGDDAYTIEQVPLAAVWRPIWRKQQYEGNVQLDRILQLLQDRGG